MRKAVCGYVSVGEKVFPGASGVIAAMENPFSAAYRMPPCNPRDDEHRLIQNGPVAKTPLSFL
jgi:hypothetical protein